MRGIPQYNIHAFNEAEAYIKSTGHDAINPCKLDIDSGIDIYNESPHKVWSTDHLRDIVIRDISELVKCDAIYMLEGWEKSIGASAEYSIARWLGIKIIHAQDRILLEYDLHK